MKKSKNSLLKISCILVLSLMVSYSCNTGNANISVDSSASPLDQILKALEQEDVVSAGKILDANQGLGEESKDKIRDRFKGLFKNFITSESKSDNFGEFVKAFES